MQEQKKSVNILILSSNLQADKENSEKPKPEEQAPNARVQPGIYGSSPLQSQHQASHISQQYNNTSNPRLGQFLGNRKSSINNRSWLKNKCDDGHCNCAKCCSISVYCLFSTD